MRKLISLIIAMLMLAGLFSVTAFAENAPEITLSTTASDLEIGDEIVVTATLSGNTGFKAMTLSLEWNEAVVEFTGFEMIEEDGEKYLDSMLLEIKNTSVECNNEKGIITVARTGDTTKEGVLFKATFKVIGYGDCQIGLKETYPDFIFNSANGNIDVVVDENEVSGLEVEVPVIAVTGVSLPATETVFVGGTKTLTATVAPDDAANKEVTWKSSNTAVATVDANGVVTGVKEGTAVITVTTVDGNKTASCSVTVSCAHSNVKNVAKVAATCQATGTDAHKECEGCGQLFDLDGNEIAIAPVLPVDAANHAGNETYVDKNDTTATHHKVKYVCCDAEKETVAHNGGTATCKELAKCQDCEREYGELNATNHVDTETKLVKKDADSHDIRYVCCNGLVETVSHSGGTATCKEMAICACGTLYGQLDPDNHAYTATEFVSISEDQHEEIYVCCGAVKATENHTGGTANCHKGALCEKCGKEYTAPDATQHDWSGHSYTWATDYSTCTVSATCANRNCNITTTETVNAVKVVTDPTCETNGSIKYTATFTLRGAVEKTETVTGEAKTGHNYGTATYEWSADYGTCTAKHTCQNANCNVTGGKVETANARRITNVVNKKATCKETGERTYTATFYASWATTQTTVETLAIDSNAHKLNYEFVAGKEPTCTKEGERTVTCENGCNTVFENEKIGALGHEWGKWEYITKPTTTKTGLQYRVCESAECDGINAREERIVPKLSKEKTEVIIDMTKPSTEEEENPNTGAPVFGMLPVAIVAAAVVFGKKR